MNKKIIAIFIVIIILILGVGFLIVKSNQKQTISAENEIGNEIRETGAFNSFFYEAKGGYIVDITSTEPGHPSVESEFMTSFMLERNDENLGVYTTNYLVSYMDIEIYSDSNQNSRIEKKLEKVIINEKEFSYYLNSDESEATLYFEIPDGNGKLTIKIEATDSYSQDGEYTDYGRTIDKEVLESKELAGILNFTINKK